MISPHSLYITEQRLKHNKMAKNKLSTTILFLLIISIFTIGCTKNNERFSEINEQKFQGRTNNDGNLNKTMNQKTTPNSEMRQNSIDACSNRSEGDSCTIDSPRGQREGTCKTVDNQLICVSERNRQMQR